MKLEKLKISVYERDIKKIEESEWFLTLDIIEAKSEKDKEKIKLKRKTLQSKERKIENNTSLEVQYNPNTMKYSKKLTWIDNASRATELRQKQYDCIEYRKLEMQLFFDFTMVNNETFDEYFKFFEIITSEIIPISSRAEGEGNDISRALNLFRPPLLRLNWGNIFYESNNEFKYNHFDSCIITKLVWTYKMFSRDGRVLRATADVTFEEINPDTAEEEANKERRGSFSRVKITKDV